MDVTITFKTRCQLGNIILASHSNGSRPPFSSSADEVSSRLQRLRDNAGAVEAALYARAASDGFPPSEDELAGLAAMRSLIAGLQSQLDVLVVNHVVGPPETQNDDVSHHHTQREEIVEGRSEAANGEASSGEADWQESLYGVPELMSLGTLGGNYTADDTTRSPANAQDEGLAQTQQSRRTAREAQKNRPLLLEVQQLLLNPQTALQLSIYRSFGGKHQVFDTAKNMTGRTSGEGCVSRS
ncbi:hypothetical protein QFC24_006128 [Naganishia onofrii]|uniref:Uncharacterized protein n=1 Tax=Naganishia onofrii TaxID=1851511 RepID=A0ACC2X353_9TREE|nr:hypothetical protein QFC24_006128 [Naganishia onofrii]